MDTLAHVARVHPHLALLPLTPAPSVPPLPLPSVITSIHLATHALRLQFKSTSSPAVRPRPDRCPLLTNRDRVFPPKTGGEMIKVEKKSGRMFIVDVGKRERRGEGGKGEKGEKGAEPGATCVLTLHYFS